MSYLDLQINYSQAFGSHLKSNHSFILNIPIFVIYWRFLPKQVLSFKYQNNYPKVNPQQLQKLQ